MTLYFFKEKATLMYVRLLVVAAFLYALMTMCISMSLIKLD